jgi:putative DNA primase/helicase
LDKAKLMMKPTGRMTGGAIRIGDVVNGELSVATGVETALSVTEVTSQVCWSCLNDGLLRGFIPPQSVTHLTVWADNDHPDSQGRNGGVLAAEALARRLNQERPEIEVVVKIPPIQGKDWNDMLFIDRKSFYD